ncbi:MAG: PRC-barrel domain-containing protein [Xanthobacteraceae bacterium]
MRTRYLLVLVAAALTALAAATSWAQNQAAPPQADSHPPASQPQNTAVPTAPKTPAPPPSVTIIGAREAHGVLGRDVRSPTDEDMGHIVDVIVDRAGVVRAAVIDFGGFLGVGSRKIAVAWNALRFPGDAKKTERVALELTRDQVRAAPEFKEDKPVVVLGASGSLESLPFP